MADGTHINWTDATWNVITGCDVLSPGCTNCYAMRLAGTRLKHHPSRMGLTTPTKTGPVWNGEARFNEQWLDQPLRWQKPRMVFVCAHGDLFYENVPDEWIEKVFSVMLSCPQHTFQVLTKRTSRMREFIESVDADTLNEFGRPIEWPTKNIWLGFSAEDQKHFDERWSHVEELARAGWTTWCSAEPLLGPIDIGEALHDSGCPLVDADWPTDLARICNCPGEPHLRWVVAGGESAQNKPGRPMHPDWPRKLRDDCVAAGVPFNFKQWGDWLPVPESVMPARPQMVRPGDAMTATDGRVHILGPLMDCRFEGEATAMRRVGAKKAGRLLDGRTWDEFPEPRNG